jgi:hypothetical protein
MQILLMKWQPTFIKFKLFLISLRLICIFIVVFRHFVNLTCSKDLLFIFILSVTFLELCGTLSKKIKLKFLTVIYIYIYIYIYMEFKFIFILGVKIYTLDREGRVS